MTYSVYVFLDDMNRPYYVGMTNNMVRRRKEHLFEIKIGNMLPKYRKARQLYTGKGLSFKMRRIRKAKTEDEAYRLERAYIQKYRRMGYVLMNCTYGGPDEIPMKINKPKHIRQEGIVLPAAKKIKKKIKTKKLSVKQKAKRVVKAIKRR